MTATAPTQTTLNLSGAFKKELIQLSNAHFSMYAVSLLLMKVQVEGGFNTALSDLGDDVGIALVFMFVVLGAICLGQLYVLFSIYQLLNAAKSAQK